MPIAVLDLLTMFIYYLTNGIQMLYLCGVLFAKEDYQNNLLKKAVATAYTPP